MPEGTFIQLQVHCAFFFQIFRFLSCIFTSNKPRLGRMDNHSSYHGLKKGPNMLFNPVGEPRAIIKRPCLYKCPYHKKKGYLQYLSWGGRITRLKM